MYSSLHWLARNKQRPPIPLEAYEVFSFSNSGTRGSPPALESWTRFSFYPTMFPAPLSFPVYSSSRPKLKPCSCWENFLGRVKGQSPDSVPFTLYILATALVSIRVISYPTIPLLFTWNLLLSRDPQGLGPILFLRNICQVNEWTSFLDKKTVRFMGIKWHIQGLIAIKDALTKISTCEYLALVPRLVSRFTYSTVVKDKILRKSAHIGVSVLSIWRTLLAWPRLRYQVFLGFPEQTLRRQRWLASVYIGPFRGHQIDL